MQRHLNHFILFSLIQKYMNTIIIGTKRKENQSLFTILLYVLLWKRHSGQRSKAFWVCHYHNLQFLIMGDQVSFAVILLSLCPASLMHKNPQRHKIIIHGMHPVGHNYQTIDLNILWKYPICLIFVDCKTVGFFREISKEIGKAWRKSLTHTKRASLSMSPQSRSFFSASF